MRSKRIALTVLSILCAIATSRSETPDVSRAQLDALLKRTGREVELFWQQVDSFTCTEAVTQEKMGRDNKAVFRRNTEFDYLALAKTQEYGPTVEESRTPRKRVPQKANQPSLLSTNGFPTLLLIFHPHQHANYRYWLDPDAGRRGDLVGVRFEHLPGMPSTCALRLKDRIYPLEMQGVAWIDADSGSVWKITAGLVAPLNDINVKALNIEVVYSPQSFLPDIERKWLPSAAVINMHTAMQHWRNTHQFSRYRRFTVQSLESTLR